MGKYKVIVEVHATSVSDEASDKRLDALTPEQTAEEVAEIEENVREMIRSNMDEGAEITVSVRLEENQ
jgi:divalent metal cation (Fe/Co/Zn/Cd) transporter